MKTIRSVSVLPALAWALAAGAGSLLAFQGRVYSELPALGPDGSITILLADQRVHHVKHQDGSLTYYGADGRTKSYTEYSTGETEYYDSAGNVQRRETEAGARMASTPPSPSPGSSSGGRGTAEAGLFNQGSTSPTAGTKSATEAPALVRGDVRVSGAQPVPDKTYVSTSSRPTQESKDTYTPLKSSGAEPTPIGPPPGSKDYREGVAYIYADGRLLCKETASYRVFYRRDGKLWWEELFDGTGHWKHYREDSSVWFVGDKRGNRTYYHTDGTPWYRRDAQGQKTR